MSVRMFATLLVCALCPLLLKAPALAEEIRTKAQCPERTVERSTASGVYEGTVFDEGVFLQIRLQDGKKLLLYGKDGQAPEELAGKVGLRLVAQYTVKELWSPLADECVRLNLLSSLSVPAQEPPDKELNEVRARAERPEEAQAKNTLGVWYEKGKHGLPVDPEEAVYWYGAAAAEGSALALHNLGDCYRQGIGVPVNDLEAFFHYLRAAAGGLPLGYMDVGDCYLNGVGVEKNRQTAVLWYRKAAQQGRKEAQEKLRQLGEAAVKVTGPLPPCPRKELGQKSISGKFAGTANYPGYYTLQIVTADGRKVAVGMEGDGDAPEFANLAQGDRIELRCGVREELDSVTAQCQRNCYYQGGSGKVLRAGP